ncbi:MAG: lysophospholipid acyltransferase family protein [Opitutaceae bacterium]|nr:lysophospholipid acyltransferase family protein [Opitutaceae bacterium]
MLLGLAKLIGWILAHLPEEGLKALAWCLGQFTYHGYRSRRRVMLHSLKSSFPEKTEAWRRSVACTSCIRLMETALLSLAAPFLSESRIRTMASATEATCSYFGAYSANPRPIVLGTAHFAYWEGLTWLPLFLQPGQAPELVTVFRPLRDPKMDEWLKSTRERFGVKLMSRRSGLHASLHVLQRKGIVTLLFDQSAGSHGYLTEFLGRECSTTPLPGMLVERTGAETAIIFARRTSFWRFTIDLVPVKAADQTPQAVTVALNRELERLFRDDENLCASWLWMHQRWRILDRPEERRKLEAKRGGLIR